MARSQGGYILPTTAVLLIPLMIFAALAVDFGGWTVQANRQQNAADAAALAGAPYLPDTAAAAAAAEQTARANGFENDANTTVDITFPDSLTLEVDLTDEATTYFASVVLNNLELRREAAATALSPITMGSPTNVLGHGPHDIGAGIGASGYFMIFNNECSSGTYGDIGAASLMRKNDNCEVQNGPNPFMRDYSNLAVRRNSGHFLIVEMPPGAPASTLWIYDPGSCPGWQYTPPSGDTFWVKRHDLRTKVSWQLWDDNDTIVNYADDVPVGAPWSSTECAQLVEQAETGGTDDHTDWTKGWTQSSITFPANGGTETDRYLIEPITEKLNPTVSNGGWNYHSYWVRPNGATTACNTITTATCPTIGAESWFVAGSVGPSAPAGETSANINRSMDLFLAEIPAGHQGKNLEVLLWDPGEGMDNLQVLDPNGKALDFTWSSNHPMDGVGSHAPGVCSAGPDLPRWAGHTHQGSNVPCLEVYSKRPGRYANWGANRWKFDGTVVVMSVPLTAANGVDLLSYPNNWFSLRYMPRAGEPLREWGSFSVRISGDPIRLVR